MFFTWRFLGVRCFCGVSIGFFGCFFIGFITYLLFSCTSWWSWHSSPHQIHEHDTHKQYSNLIDLIAQDHIFPILMIQLSIDYKLRQSVIYFISPLFYFLIFLMFFRRFLRDCTWLLGIYSICIGWGLLLLLIFFAVFLLLSLDFILYGLLCYGLQDLIIKIGVLWSLMPRTYRKVDLLPFIFDGTSQSLSKIERNMVLQ